MVLNREVAYDEAQNLAALIGALYFEVSSKENINIEEAFSEVIHRAVTKIKNQS